MRNLQRQRGINQFVARLIHRVAVGLTSRMRNLMYRILGVQITGRIWMRAIEIPRCWDAVSLDNCSLDRGVTLLATQEDPGVTRISIASGTYINRFTMIDAHDSIQIGAVCMIGPGCYITDADHGTHLNSPITRQSMVSAPVIIEDGVWLGAHVKVLKGVTIGHGTVIGAGAVVTKSIPANSIAVGIPARVVGTRSKQAKAS